MSDFVVGERVRVQTAFNRSKLLPAIWKIVEINSERATLTIPGLYRYKVIINRLVKIDVVEQLGSVA